MVRRPIIRSGAVFGIALGGLLAGHALAYAGLAPNASSRAALLAATGHGYLPAADSITIVAALTGLAVVFLGRLTGAPDGIATFGAFARRLVAFQAIGFVVLEIAERLGAGAPLGDLSRALPMGVVVQVAVALLSAALLRWLLRVADRVRELTEGAPVPAQALSRPIVVGPALANHAPALGGIGNRDPPPRLR